MVIDLPMLEFLLYASIRDLHSRIISSTSNLLLIYWKHKLKEQVAQFMFSWCIPRYHEYKTSLEESTVC